MTASLSQRLPRRAAKAPAADAHAAGYGAKAFRALAGIVTTGLMVVAVAAFLFLAVGPRIFGYQTSTMLTGSMSPVINPGDVVVSVPAPVSDLKTGDIITYGIPVEDQRIETHRIIEITRDDSGTSVRTKGDANNGPDPWTAILKGDTVHVHRATIPYLGTAIRTLREPLLLQTLMYGAPAVLVTMLLFSIWRKEPKANNSSPSGNTADDHRAT